MSAGRVLHRWKSKLSGYVHDTAFWGTALLLTGVIATGPAFSQKADIGGYADHHAGWSVSQINAQNNAGEVEQSRPYCVMARRFDNGVILSFAKNIDGQKSLALDFQSSKLTKDQIYRVILQAGQDVTRGFEVSPVTQRAFVIKMGRDAAFFRSLEAGRPLSVNYSGHVLHFDTSSFYQGNERLNSCLRKASEPAKLRSDIQQAELRLDRDTVREVNFASAVGRIEPASGDLASTQLGAGDDAKRDSLVQQTPQLRTDRNVAVIRDLQRKLSILEAKNQELMSEISSADSDSGRLNVPQGEAVQKHVDAGQLEELRDDNRILSLKNKQLRDELTKALAHSDGNSDLEDELSEQNAGLVKHNKELKVRLANFESAKINSEAQAQEQEGKINRMTSLVSALKEELELIRRENADLRERNADYELSSAAGPGQEELCLSTNNWDLERATRRYQEAQREIQRLGQSLRDQKAQCRQEVRSIEAQLFSPGGHGGVDAPAQNRRFVEMRQRLLKLSEELQGERLASRKAEEAQEQELESMKEELLIAKSQASRAYAKVELAEASAESSAQDLEDNRNQLANALEEAQTLKDQKSMLQEELLSLKVILRETEAELEDAVLSSARYTQGHHFDPRQSGADLVPLAPSRRNIHDRNTGENDLMDLVSTQINEANLVQLAAAIGVQIDGTIFQIPAEGPGKLASYRWDTTRLLGAADIYELAPGIGFVAAVDDYYQRAQHYCPGGFLSEDIWEDENYDLGIKLSLQKIICHDGAMETVKSVLFVGKPGEFSVISHEDSSLDKSVIRIIHDNTARFFPQPAVTGQHPADQYDVYHPAASRIVPESGNHAPTDHPQIDRPSHGYERGPIPLHRGSEPTRTSPRSLRGGISSNSIPQPLFEPVSSSNSRESVFERKLSHAGHDNSPRYGIDRERERESSYRAPPASFVQNDSARDLRGGQYSGSNRGIVGGPLFRPVPLS